MASDRLMCFAGKPVPGRDAVQVVIEDFLGGIGSIEWSGDRFIVTLPGKGTLALQRTSPVFAGVEGFCHEDGRWFEVWFGDDCIDVITRFQDDFTNALAKRFASIIAHWWEGKLEDA
jgi:hypothetical protein